MNDYSDCSVRNPEWRAFLGSKEPNRIVKPRLMYAFIIPGMIVGYIFGAHGGAIVYCFSGTLGLLFGGYLYFQYRMRKLRRHFQAHIKTT